MLSLFRFTTFTRAGVDGDAQRAALWLVCLFIQIFKRLEVGALNNSDKTQNNIFSFFLTC